MSNIYGISADWLLNGQGDMQRAIGPGFKGRTVRIDPPDYTQAGHGDFRFAEANYVMVRRVELSVSAGSGVVAVDGELPVSMALPTLWFQSAGVNSDLTVLVRVKGDSMAPTIPDGGFVLIHLIEKQVLKPGIYAFSRDGHAFVKRLVPSDRNTDGRARSIMILSDNPAYLPEVVTGSNLNEMRVIGRVRAVFTMLD